MQAEPAFLTIEQSMHWSTTVGVNLIHRSGQLLLTFSWF